MKKNFIFDATFFNFSVYVLKVNHGLVKRLRVLVTFVAKPFSNFIV